MSAPSTPVGPSTGPASVPRAAASAPTLLYIVGHHKSGSTPLGAMLSGHPDVFFAGEVYRFPRPIWVPGDRARLCSCGRPVLDCPLWSTVRAEFEARGSLEALRAGQVRFERPQSFLRSFLARGTERQALLRHVGGMHEMVRVLAHVAGARIVVESSFSAVRGWVYRRPQAAGVPVRYLHLVRDGRAFLWSELRITEAPEEGGWWVRAPPVIVARWMAMNLLAVLLCSWDRDRYLRVRYEDLVAHPRATLERIGAFAGVDLEEVIGKLERRVPIPQRHIAAGSWHRLDGPLVLRPDVSWRTGLPRRTRTMFWLTTGWLARLLGYRRTPGDGPAAAR